MNPERIFREYRDDALAKQITAKEYSTFVAMPFQERFSYLYVVRRNGNFQGLS